MHRSNVIDSGQGEPEEGSVTVQTWGTGVSKAAWRRAWRAGRAMDGGLGGKVGDQNVRP